MSKFQTLTAAQVARYVRAARDAGASAVELDPGGRVRILLAATDTAPSPTDELEVWRAKRERQKNACAKT